MHPEDTQAFVYFTQAINGGPVKIGKAADPVTRLKEIQTGHPYKLRVIATTPGGFALERDLHTILSGVAMYGEWFAPGRDLHREMCRLGLRQEAPASSDGCSVCGESGREVDADDAMCVGCFERWPELSRGRAYWVRNRNAYDAKSRRDQGRPDVYAVHARVMDACVLAPRPGEPGYETYMHFAVKGDYHKAANDWNIDVRVARRLINEHERKLRQAERRSSVLSG